MKKENNTVFI